MPLGIMTMELESHELLESFPIHIWHHLLPLSVITSYQYEWESFEHIKLFYLVLGWPPWVWQKSDFFP